MADAYAIEHAPEAADDMRGLRAFDRAAVVNGVETFLRFEPTRESRSRIKRMVQPFWTQYRLRSDDFWVYYDVDDARRTVSVLRVLFKGAGTAPKENP